MKICHVFNMANNAYNIVKALRSNGVDADLILNSHDFGMSLPMWEDNELNMDPYDFDLAEAAKHYNFPDWMRIWWNGGNVIRPQKILNLFYMAKDYDLIHLHPPSPIYLQFSRKPFIIHESGWLRKMVWMDTATEKLARRAYSKANYIVMTNPDEYTLLESTKYKKQVFIPFIIDTDKYKSSQVRESEELLFFHPARHVWDVKGNDKLLCAFKRFADEGYKARLRLIDWGWQEDVAKSKQLITKLGLESYVEWMAPYSKPALIRAYNEADVVFDQFILGSGRTTMFEAIACEVPVVIYLNGWNLKCFDEMPPTVNALTVEDIYNSMVLLTDSALRKRIGERERRFVQKHNSPDVVAKQFIKLYEDILD